MDTKLSPQIQLALLYESILPYTAFWGIIGRPIGDQKWEVLIRYLGDLTPIEEEMGISFQIIALTYATVLIDKTRIRTLATYEEIGYIEFPEVMEYILEPYLTDVCLTENVVSEQGYNLTGKGTIVAIIDSGIDYMHEDFTNEDNTSRILFLWDQNIEGNPPNGFTQGTEYTREDINRALNAPTEEEQLSIVPSVDTLGHGTHITGIAAGNGKRSNGRYRGVAVESELVIVKLKENPALEVEVRGPRNIDVMAGLKYVEEKARLLNKPVSVLMGIGINEGAHEGLSSIETFINQITRTSVMNVSVGTGNQADKDTHTSGTVAQGQRKQIQISIDEGQAYYFCTLWKSFVDEMSLVIISSSGKRTEELSNLVNNRAFVFDNTVVLVNFSEPTSSEKDQQIIIFLERAGAAPIDAGIWTIELRGIAIITGQYNIWSSSLNTNLRATRFLEPDPYITLTIPSTAMWITSVAAFNELTNQVLPFSGRGFTRTGNIKPDITCPGFNVMTASNKSIEGYLPVTGSSVAAAFMCGAYALFMEYGIVQGRDSFLYGERLKAYVWRNARRPLQYAPYPNRLWGYGILCIVDVLDDLARRYETQ